MLKETDKKGSRISIAMAVYNGERFVREQLESFTRQTLLPDELVVSDDASTDRSVGIVRAFAERAPFPVRIYAGEQNVGIEKNFERAIAACSSDIIATSDFDDVWYPEKIATVVKALDQHPEAGILISDADLVDENLEPLGRRLFQTRSLSRSCRSEYTIVDGTSCRRIPCNGMSLAFRTNLRPFVLPLPEAEGFRKWGVYDYLVVNVVLLSGLAKGLLVSRPLGAYRQHSHQMIGAMDVSSIKKLKLGWGERGEHRSEPVLTEIATRLNATPIPSDAKAARIRIRALIHCRARSGLPSRRILRLPIVIRELVKMRYHRFSSGTKSAVKDLIFA